MASDSFDNPVAEPNECDAVCCNRSNALMRAYFVAGELQPDTAELLARAGMSLDPVDGLSAACASLSTDDVSSSASS